jgi:hypothetical protein
LRNESGYLAPTPYGDAADVVMTDVLDSVLMRYDTVIVAHRLTTEPTETARKLGAYAAAGGNLVLTASSLADMAGSTVLGWSVDAAACQTLPAGTAIELVPSGQVVVEPGSFVLCPLQGGSGPATVLARLANNTSQPVAVRSGSMVLLAAGNYGMGLEPNPSASYQCGVDQPATPGTQPYAMLAHVQALMQSAMANASLFDLGPNLAWVPKLVIDEIMIFLNKKKQIFGVDLCLDANTSFFFFFFFFSFLLFV